MAAVFCSKPVNQYIERIRGILGEDDVILVLDVERSGKR